MNALVTQQETPSTAKEPRRVEEVMSIVNAVLLLTQIILTALVLRVVTSNAISPELQQPSNSRGAPIVQGVSPDDDPSLGRPDAPVTIVEFADFQCPACALAHPVVMQVVAEFQDRVRLVVRDYPLQSIHPDAFRAAEAANCALGQGAYWEMHDTLYANQDALDENSLTGYAKALELDVDRFRTCMETHQTESEIYHDIGEGDVYVIDGTPTYFVNGVRLTGAEQLRATVERLVNETTSSP